MDTSVYKTALTLARSQAADLDVKIAELQRMTNQRKNLDELLRALEAVIYEDSPKSDLPGALAPMFRGVVVPGPFEPAEHREDRLWKILQTILQMKQRPMTAQAILDELDKTDRTAIQGENRLETVRIAMVRKSDVFEEVVRGLFVLKEWHERMKNPHSGPEGAGGPEC